MQYTKLEALLTDKQDIAILRNLSQEELSKPVLMRHILGLVDDASWVAVGDDLGLRLFRLLKEYFNSCWDVYMDVSVGKLKLDKLIEDAVAIRYYVDAPYGVREATEKEIEQGVAELITKEIPAISEDEIKYLYILLWTLSGRIKYYKKAGLVATYEDDKLVETKLELILRAGKLLREMVDWAGTGSNVELAVKRIKQSKKNTKNYKYPTFAKDEITCNIPAKQIVFMCKQRRAAALKRGTHKEMRGILYKVERDAKYKLKPHEIAIMRRACDEIGDDFEVSTDDKANILCNKLLDFEKRKLISRDAFALKLVKSVKSRGVCSDKQFKIMYDEVKKVEDKLGINKQEKPKETESNDIMDELYELSDALGSGVLEV